MCCISKHYLPLCRIIYFACYFQRWLAPVDAHNIALTWIFCGKSIIIIIVILELIFAQGFTMSQPHPINNAVTNIIVCISSCDTSFCTQSLQKFRKLPHCVSPQGSAEAQPLGAQVLTFQVTPSDYLLGVADLTGELMRMCISSVGNGDIDTPFRLSQFLRQIHDGFSYIGNTGPYEVSKKLHTLRQSLGKVEDACYTLHVRGSEIPKHMLADVFSSRTTLIDPEEGVV